MNGHWRHRQEAVHIHWVILDLSRFGRHFDDPCSLKRHKVVPHLMMEVRGHLATRHDSNYGESDFTGSVYNCWFPAAGFDFRCGDVEEIGYVSEIGAADCVSLRSAWYVYVWEGRARVGYGLGQNGQFKKDHDAQDWYWYWIERN